MEVIVPVLIFLFIFFAFMVVVGHGIWLLLAWIFKRLFGKSSAPQSEGLSLESCPTCKVRMWPGSLSCTACGWSKAGTFTGELFREIGATHRQLQRLHKQGSISAETYRELQRVLQIERERLASPTKHATQESQPITPIVPRTYERPPSVTDESQTFRRLPAISSPEIPLPGKSVVERGDIPDLVTAFKSFSSEDSVGTASSETHRRVEEPKPATRPKFEPVTAKPRRAFTEILTAFMEQSNIRWGEIIGGLLIIGCSTALVISLWNEISQIPLLKFFIFTSVTTALFGMGFYSEHRWKLPTTSRGILTIATLLVPLNFLAIAAVSRGPSPSGTVVLASELFAPALFFCLVYFAGRVITSAWPHLLVFGVLGSSLGQLLVRHFAHAGIEPLLLVGLGLFPLVCFIGATGWMVRRASREAEISEGLANTIFITLGASVFSSLLSIGLLLFKVGQAREAMIHLAPLLTLGGGPILVCGLILWQRVRGVELATTRMVGTSIALIGSLLALAGIVLSFPNPTSVVIAAFVGFVIFTLVAFFFNQPRAHLFATTCFALGFVVATLAFSGQVEWQASTSTSLLSDLFSIRSGQALAVVFLLYLSASEVLSRRKDPTASLYYVISASVVGAASLVLVIRVGLGKTGDPFYAAPIFALLAAGAFFISWRRRMPEISWVSSGVLLLAIAQILGPVLSIRFPWQAAFLVHAIIASVAALYFFRHRSASLRAFARPLNWTAFISTLLVIVAMSQAYRWESTAMLAQRLLWLAGIWLVMLWINRSQLLFTAMQGALTLSVILAVKLGLQHYEWYAYLRNAWLHPWSLQIQGSVLLLLGLGWAALRIFVRRRVSTHDKEPVSGDQETNVDERWADVAWSYLNSSWTTLDRVLTWCVLVGFVLMGIYGALNGVKLELTIRGGASTAWNVAGFAHEHSYGPGAWLVFALLLTSMFVGLWERRKFIYALGLLITITAAVPLLALRWEASYATTSAWRWLSAVGFLLLSLPIWWRSKVETQLRAFGWPAVEQEKLDPVAIARQLLTILTVVPLLTLTLYPALKAIEYMPVHGPSSGFFFFIGNVISYSVPLVLAGLVLIGHAIRERVAGYAFAAGLFFNLAVTIAQLLTIASVGGSMNRVVLVQVLQLNVIATSCFALVWLATRQWWQSRPAPERIARTEVYLKLQIAIELFVFTLIVVPLAAWLCARPTWAGPAIAEAGNARGWLTFVLAFMAAFWFSTSVARTLKAWLVFAASAAAGTLVAFSITRWQAGSWAGYHALLLGSIATSWLMLFAAKLPDVLKRREGQTYRTESQVSIRNLFDTEWKWDAAFFASIAGVWIVLMALRAAPSDPSKPWWSVGALIATSALAAGLNWETLSRGYLYAAAGLVNLAASIWFLTYWSFEYRVIEKIEFIYLNVIALALPAIVWLFLELRAQRVDPERRSQIPSFHHIAAIVALAAVAVLAFDSVVAEFASFSVDSIASKPQALLEWLGIFSTIVLMAACLWDRRARYAVAGLYLLGLVTATHVLTLLELGQNVFAWLLMMAMALYAVATSFIWKRRASLIAIAERVGIPARTESPFPALGWLRVLNTVLSSTAAIFAYWIVLRFVAWPMRFTSAIAVGAQGLAFGVMAKGEKRELWQRVSLFVFALGTVLFGWAWLVPGTSGTWLNRAVVLMMVMFGMIALYGFGTDDAIMKESDWTRAARRCIPWFAGTGALALLFVLVTEVVQQTEFGGVRTSVASLIIVAVTLIFSSALCIFFAVKPTHDPLKLSESGRMKYVYVAEALVALLFMHIRLTMPWLFTGFFEQYWPLVIVFLAFVGVGISELLRTQGVLVVAKPVERTGVFLPLLPVIGFWIIDSRVDYSIVLFMIGLLYASLSILRRSFTFGILAAVAGNGGLWYMLHQTESYGFLHHPQLWIIPVAVCVLIAAYLNRESFTDDQMAGIRYVTLMMIYVSSTSDILINGVAESPWLPLALGGLSLVGVMCGIMLRVRAFLFLGAGFLLIAVISMIWYASDNLGWTWLWWVAGIVTGALIIFTFALFEKKRGEMLQVLEDLREWHK